METRAYHRLTNAPSSSLDTGLNCFAAAPKDCMQTSIYETFISLAHIYISFGVMHNESPKHIFLQIMGKYNVGIK